MRRAVARFVAVIAGAGLLAEAAHCANPVGNRAVARAFGQAVRQPLALANPPAHVEAGEVGHGERPHRQAQLVRRSVHILGQAAFLDQVFRLGAVRMQHAVPYEPVAHAHHDPDLLNAAGDRLRRRQRGETRLFAAHDFQQPHDVGRAEEVHPQHLVRSRGRRGNGVHVQGGRVRRQNAVGLGRCVELREHGFLHVHVLEHGFDDQVGVGHVGIVQAGCDEVHALRDLFVREAAFPGAAFVVAAHDGHALVQQLLAGLQQRDGDAGVGEGHGDAAAHRARADDADLADRQGFGVLGHVADLGRGAFGKEDVPLRGRLPAGQHVAEQLLLLGESFVERQGTGRLDAVDAALRRLEAATLHRETFARGSENGRIHAGHLVGQIAHFLERRTLGHEGTRERERTFAQGALLDEFVYHAGRVCLAGRHGHAAGDDLQRGFGADQPRQALRAATPGQQPQRHLGQSDPCRRHRHAVMAAQRGFQSAAERGAVYRGDDGFLQVFDDLHRAQKARRLERLAELGDVRAGNEGPPRADEDGGARVVAARRGETVEQPLPDVLAQGVHGRVVEGDDPDVAVSGVGDGPAHLHGVVLSLAGVSSECGARAHGRIPPHRRWPRSRRGAPRRRRFSPSREKRPSPRRTARRWARAASTVRAVYGLRRGNGEKRRRSRGVESVKKLWA